MLSTKIILFGFFFCCTLAISAQEINYISQYPDEDVITVSLEKHIKIEESRGKLNITQNVNKRNLFISTDALRHSEDEVSYNTFNTIKTIKAFTEHTVDGKINSFPVKRFEDKDVLMNSVFFNDQKEKKIIFPNVKKNAITNLEYTLDINDPHFIPANIFWSNMPIVQSKISVSFPNNVKVAYKEFNLDSVSSSFETFSDGDMTTFSWTLNNIPKTSRHYDFSALFYIPQIIIYIDSYVYKNRKISILNNIDDLYKWYVSLTSKINGTGKEQLQSITLDLIKDTDTEEEKIKNIYYFIQDKINYIAFEDGLNGFIPRNAIDVYLKKYGDCKDMANILDEMLGYAGIDSHLTWIGTRKKPYSYEELHTPVVDNHMITTVITKEKDTLFLDATAKYLPFGYPSPFIQGKQALIGISPSLYKIKTVPVVDVFKNRIDIESELVLTNRKVIGIHKAKILGHDKLTLMHKIENKTKEDLGFLHRNLKWGTEQTSFKNIVYQNLERKKDTLKISFNSETSNHIRNVAGKLYIKPNLDSNLIGELIKDEAMAFAKEIDSKSIKTFQTVLHIPNDYEIDFIPEGMKSENDEFHFKITYERLEDRIIIKKQLIIDTLKVEVTNIDIWNKFIRSLSKANKQTIVLRYKN